MHFVKNHSEYQELFAFVLQCETFPQTFGNFVPIIRLSLMLSDLSF